MRGYVSTDCFPPGMPVRRDVSLAQTVTARVYGRLSPMSPNLPAMYSAGLVRRLSMLLTLVGAACTAAPTAASVEVRSPSIAAGYVSVTTASDGLVVENQTERAVFYAAIDKETSMVLFWAPCTGGPACAYLSQGERKTLPWSKVVGYMSDRRDFVVYWWHVDVTSLGPRVVSVQSVNVSR